LKAYPCVEQGGVIWAYMGPPELKPALPALEWATVPADQRFVSKRLQECNYLQAMEGGFDSIHSLFLHKYSVGEDPLLKRDSESLVYIKADPHPKFIPMESPGGLYITTRRNAEGNKYHWRVTQWLMPWYNLFPPYEGNPMGGHAWVPIDDENCWTWSMDYHPDRPLTGQELEAMRAGKGIHVQYISGTYRPLANKDNDYLLDRVAQKQKKTFSGIEEVSVQDAAVQESMGPIQDRTKEHLVSSDNGIIMMRQRLLKTALANREGIHPPGLDAAAQRVRAATVVLPREVTLQEVAKEVLMAKFFT
ncbi:MAG TPA: hypothetical protein VK138_05170, partial [Acidiferrobacterales bacterium]|nr:hypothetical protein [Acidiferrobacterales bacterium]